MAVTLVALAVTLGVSMVLWRAARTPPTRLNDGELAARTAVDGPSAGARWARLDGEVVSWWEFGDPNGAPLIALHGLGVSGLAFSENDALFRKGGIRCIAPTLVGGLSERAPGASIADLSRSVLRLADHLGLERWHLVGVSYGTLPVLGVAALAPARVVRAGLFGVSLHGDWCAEDPTTITGFKDDNAVLLRFGRRWPGVLYPWMRAFGTFSAARILSRFRDEKLPLAECALLESSHPYHQLFARLWAECGQRGFWYLALGWEAAIARAPGFTLAQVDAGRADLFVETGEHDNVHLPRMSAFVCQRVRASTLNVVKDQGRLGCVGAGLEAGIARLLDSSRPT